MTEVLTGSPTPGGPITPTTGFEKFISRVKVYAPRGTLTDKVRDAAVQSLDVMRSLYHLDTAGMDASSAGMSQEQYDHEQIQHLTKLASALAAQPRDTWIDFGTIPPQLPYNPIPVMGFGQQIPWLKEQQVSYFNAQLQQPPYNYPTNPALLAPEDVADASAQPFGTIFQYRSEQMPTMILKEIVISAQVDLSRAQDYEFFDLHLDSAFFSEPWTEGSPSWAIEYLNASTIKYTTPPEPNTYPANFLLRWDSVQRLNTLAQSNFGRDASSFTNKIGSQVQSVANCPYSNNVWHWTIKCHGGVVVRNGDIIKMTTGIPTVDENNRNYLKKLYAWAHFEIPPQRYDNLQATKRQVTVAHFVMP